MAEDFGLNDELLEDFGLDDSLVGQDAVTQPPVAPGVGQVAQAARQVPRTTPGARQVMPPQGGAIDPQVDAATQMGMGFAPDQGEKLSYLARRLEEAYKQPVQVRPSPKDNGVEFFSPKQQKWIKAQESGLGPFAVDLVGGIGGAKLGADVGAITGNPVGVAAGAIAGGVVGTAASQVAKNYIGKKIGALDPDYPIGSDVGGAAAEGAVWESGAMGALGIAKYARYWFKGAKPFASDEAAALGEAAARADEIIKEIEDKTGQTFNPTIGQKTINANMVDGAAREKALGYEAALAGDAEAGTKLRDLHRSNEDALVSYFDASTDPLTRRAIDSSMQLDPQQAQKNVVEALTDGHDKLMSGVRQAVSQLPDELPASQAGKIMRGALAEADKAFKASVEDPAWAKYRDGTGYNSTTFSSKVRVPWNDDVKALMSSWDQRSRDAIINAIQNDNSGLKLLFKEEVVPASKILGKDGKPLVAGSRKPIEDVDLAVLDDTIKWLRSDARSALKNKQGVSYNERDLVNLENTLSKMRDEHLATANPDLHALLMEAEGATKLRAAQFKSGAIKDLLIKDGPGHYRLSDADAVYKILNSKDDVAAKQFADLTKGYPEAKIQAQHMVYGLYRKAVVDPRTGAPNPKAHAKFMREYGSIVRTFFPGAEDATFRRIGGLGKAIAKEEADLKKVLPQVRKTFEGELESLSATSLADVTLRKGSSPEKIKLASSILMRNGKADLVEEWQHSVLDELSKRVIKNGKVDTTQLAKMTAGPEAETLRTLLNAGGLKKGDSYIESLKILNEAVTMIRTKGVGKLEPQSQGFLVRFMRLIMPPFSPQGRLVTFGAQARTKAVPGEIYKALTDPEQLKKLAIQTKKDMNSARKAAYLGALGHSLAENDFNY